MRDPRTGRLVWTRARTPTTEQIERLVERLAERSEAWLARQGLIWHTQGSGKSLTMVFAALKLKFHRGIRSDALQNPNLLVITDRKDLHDQISKTFEACGLPNPQDATSIRRLRELIVPGVAGRTVMSTIFKFQWDEAGLKSTDMATRKAALASMELPDSENWIMMVDEAHRTQEKDLGAYMRAVLPNAVRFALLGILQPDLYAGRTSNSSLRSIDHIFLPGFIRLKKGDPIKPRHSAMQSA